MVCMVVDAFDGGRVKKISKPFIASDKSWGVCDDPPKGLKFTRARGSLQWARGVQPPIPQQFEHCRYPNTRIRRYRWLLSMPTWRHTYFPQCLRPRRIYDFFAPHINVLTYLLTYVESRADKARYVQRLTFCLDQFLSPARPVRSQID